MDYFESDGLKLAFRVEGEGDPIVLAHGFASTHRANWIETGWSRALMDAGFRVIMPDMRGHGTSEASYDRDDYTLSAMAGDLVALLDHLGEAGADLMGYSMGAMAALVAAMEHGGRFDRVIAAGVGARLLDADRDPGPVVAALLADDPSGIADKGALGFRLFADRNGQDRRALATCFEAVRAPFPVAGLGDISRPVLVVTGEEDEQARAPGPLAALIPGARAVTVPKRDHMKTVGDRAYKEAVLKFLAG
ncbi:alpha/beta fold hydrolase [Parvibaculum sp.]|uniref:alpha/beta fold hydrolase n=1 Tax=Parvibaculum sp. TaxID=2024848 RepID=UPI001E16C1E4|nr:alpha/beta fold hydrolase [Parvibaculum sp.]MBX3488367.1 alpha/beta fold hydrolase [Parvibaculum sp.]MCW5727655.1 alpha/beta fold hydrolase [Parvibaculum sp.]